MYIGRLASEREVPSTITEQEVRYTFTTKTEKLMYNPDSIIKYFRKGGPRIFWSDKGHPTFVWNQLMKRPTVFGIFKSANGVTSCLCGSQNVNNLKPEVVLYERGYLIITLTLSIFQTNKSVQRFMKT